MSRRVLADKKQDKDAWLAARRSVVTATEAAVIVRGGAAVEALLARKRSGVEPDLSRVAAVRHGLEREERIAQWAALRWPGARVSELLVHAPGNRRHAATPDMVRPGGVIEIKTGRHSWGACPNRDRYVDQVQWQLYCCGVDRGVIVYEQHEDGVPVDMEPTIIPVPRDGERIAQLVASANAFLERLDAGEAGAPLDEELDVAAAQFLEYRDAAQLALKRQKAVWEALQHRAAAHLDGAGTFTQESPEVRVTWTVREKTLTRLDEDAARAAHPKAWAAWEKALLAHTTKETVTDRRLTVTRSKGTSK